MSNMMLKCSGRSQSLNVITFVNEQDDYGLIKTNPHPDKINQDSTSKLKNMRWLYFKDRRL